MDDFRKEFVLIKGILEKYKDELDTINMAYLNNEFDPEIIEDVNIYYYLDSKAYQKYKVKELAIKLQESFSELPRKDYSILTYINLEEHHGIELPYIIDEDWTDEEIYYYLIHFIYDETDHFLTEQAILNGDFLEILSAIKKRVKV